MKLSSDRSVFTSTAPLSRRQTLTGLAGIGTVGLAGCLGSDDNSGDDSSGSGDNSPGTAEITFHGETYSYNDASCEGTTTFPPENQMIHYRDYGTQFEFWVERYDPEQSDTVKVHLGFPESSGQTIGEIEAYEGQTTADEIEFELESHTSGSLALEPASDMNDDVEHDPDGGVVEWDVSC
ncbi:hypothetical protein ACLI4R_05755 [Natrialbaceae archaeon A-chndr2]|uniref:Lipoprotein n=1 Tax=Natronosalvus hydrolyticus TaxID=2979988 RepID=A0AAP3E622_9EURY|nr:hypothetical protein [Halobacteria archaeon AArc-curdl1]